MLIVFTVIIIFLVVASAIINTATHFIKPDSPFIENLPRIENKILAHLLVLAVAAYVTALVVSLVFWGLTCFELLLVVTSNL